MKCFSVLYKIDFTGDIFNTSSTSNLKINRPITYITKRQPYEKMRVQYIFLSGIRLKIYRKSAQILKGN
jgi:hypothetical protein